MKVIIARALALSFASLVGFGISSVASAAGGGDANGWVGVQGGLSVPNYSNTTARPMFGITAGAKLGSEFGIGAYYNTSKKDETVNGGTVPGCCPCAVGSRLPYA